MILSVSTGETMNKLSGIIFTTILAFSLEGVDSIACTLLHDDDDWPASSDGVYFATDTGGSPLGIRTAMFSRKGVSGVPVNTNSQYWWICF